jgi:hypothetical protein
MGYLTQWAIRTLMASVLVAAMAARTQAEFTVVFTSAVPSGGNTIWNYELRFFTRVPIGTAQLSPGNFLTLVDFSPDLTSSSPIAAPAGFSYLIQPTGLPDVPSPGLTDSPAINNVVFTYNGPTVTVDTIFPASITLPGVSLATRTGQFTTTFTTVFNFGPGPPQTSITSGTGPIALPLASPTSVAEPTSLLLLSLGFAGAVCLNRWRRDIR